jgi:hypothetical protein
MMREEIIDELAELIGFTHDQFDELKHLPDPILVFGTGRCLDVVYPDHGFRLGPMGHYELIDECEPDPPFPSLSPYQHKPTTDTIFL